MDKKAFEERVQRLKEVDGVIKSLDPRIREVSFRLLEPYIIGKKAAKSSEEEETQSDNNISGEETDRDAFFKKFNHEKPSQNVFLIVAYLYSQFGRVPILTDEIKQIADDVGITVPGRVDMTLSQAKRKGKNLFNRIGAGQFRPTVHGEQFFKDTYKVSKGTKKKEAEVKQ